ncbi:hypothetical protein [Streptomyces sp. MUM 178J]|uniref:hypothetical protein n=1 Tax=Streptomyces sp. MUM 178J TaxID=2791991 RepID=UPI001F03ABFD|nr:hypothetical protein [Streptomyces sp. MUM 178J]WRQ78545.1 hypothetical protein I3F59_003645 [Streptomyces sp. MUM 178J]
MTENRTAIAPAGASKTPRSQLVQGPGLLLVWLYGVMSVGSVSRSAYQILTEFDRAPLAYSLSAVAAVVYAFITYTLVRGGERARRAALACCAAELAGVLIVGTWTLLEPSLFPDDTVWTTYGMGYVFIPVLLPVTGMLWLRRPRISPPPRPVP